MKLNFSLDSALVITLMTIFLYASGQAYLGGLLREFYIDPIILNFSIQDKIYWGFLKGQAALIYLFLVSLICYAFRFFIIYTELNQKLVNFIRSRAKSTYKYEIKIHNSSSIDERDKNYSAVTLSAMIIYGLFLGIIFALYNIEEKGMQDGKKAFNNFSQLPSVQLENKSIKIKYYRFFCGSSLCIVIDEYRNVHLIEPKKIIYLNKKKLFKNH